MELDTQERKRNDGTLFKFEIKSNSQITTSYILSYQKWLIEDHQRKQDSVDGIGPLRLVRNKMAHAAYKGKRTIKHPESTDSKTQ